MGESDQQLHNVGNLSVKLGGVRKTEIERERECESSHDFNDELVLKLLESAVILFTAIISLEQVVNRLVILLTNSFIS